MKTNKSQKTAVNIEQKKARKRENGLKDEKNSVQNDKTKEILKKSEKKESLKKERRSAAPENDSDNQVKIPAPTITPNILNYE